MVPPTLTVTAVADCGLMSPWVLLSVKVGGFVSRMKEKLVEVAFTGVAPSRTCTFTLRAPSPEELAAAVRLVLISTVPLDPSTVPLTLVSGWV